MSESSHTVVKVSGTPEQAKICVAMLQAEGIPAFTDAQSAPDEFAMSQRLMNLSGSKVMVPNSAVDRAREILKPQDVDLDELTRQALEAGEDPAADI
ncbi:MAG: hypothetical protein AB8H80_04220 [Planctomycetota bacterium]